jgi:hypothetical protein
VVAGASALIVDLAGSVKTEVPVFAGAVGAVSAARRRPEAARPKTTNAVKRRRRVERDITMRSI